MWIDILEDRLQDALEVCKDKILDDKKNDLVVLYDSSLPDHLIRQINQLKTPRSEGGFGWKKVVPWESFVGGECDTVVYVGSGSLEAFSRARLKLMIITVSPRERKGETVKNFYDYIAGLKKAVEKNLVEKKIIEKLREDSALDIDHKTSNLNDFENEDNSEQTFLLPMNPSR